MSKPIRCYTIFCFWIIFASCFSIARADILTLSHIDFSSRGNDKLQIELEINGGTLKNPKSFKMDNPARIVLDFDDVKSGLAKKIYPINRGATSNVYVIEAENRLRVVVNLLEVTPFESKIEGNKFLLTLHDSKENNVANLNSPEKTIQKEKSTTLPENVVQTANSFSSELLPKQLVSGFDFKRGNHNEGRILLSLANPNTIVNSKKENGKVIVTLLNTQSSNPLAKRLDVSEFATPVKFIDAVSNAQQIALTITPMNDLFDYAIFQSNNLLTIEFRQLTLTEKEAEDKSRNKYTGDRLSLNFQDIDVRSVINILAEFTGQNIVASDEVKGNITLKLDNVPWDEVLDFVMMTKELEKFKSDDIILIAPIKKIKEYKESQKATEKVIESSDPLITEYIKINYAKAENFRNLLNGYDTGSFGSCGVSSKNSDNDNSSSSSSSSNMSSDDSSSNDNSSRQSSFSKSRNKNDKDSNDETDTLISDRGSAVVDSRTNTLIVRETAKRLDEIKKLIHRLDVPVRQVMIESRIVIADDTFLKNLGVKFGSAKQGLIDSGSAGYAIGGSGTRGSAKLNGTQTISDNYLVDLGAAAIGSTPPGALGMTLARGADYVLNLEVQALQQEGRGESISNPRVMTMDRCSASIQQGVEIPYTTGSSSNSTGTGTTQIASNTTNTQFKLAVLRLSVTPQITPNGSVVMNLTVKKDNVNESITVSNGKALDKRELRTSVLVEDGETIVLGGVYEDDESLTKNKIPFFADLPVVGDLFRNSAVKNQKKELLIFVTPKIVKDNEAVN